MYFKADEVTEPATSLYNPKAIDCTERAAEVFASIRRKKQEHFAVATLDSSHQLIKMRVITIGTLNSSLVHPREVFAAAISDRAASIIVAHNHPSGCLTPSDADRTVTARLEEAGKILGINVLDHLVVTSKGHGAVHANGSGTGR